MSESLILRVKRLVSGSVNGVVDALENASPELVMREAIREIERASADIREELGSVMASRQQTVRLIERSKGKLIELGNRAKLAVEQGRDDLAEAAVSRQLDIKLEIPNHEMRLQEFIARQSELDGFVAGRAARKAQLEADLSAFLRDREAAALAAGTNAGAAPGVKAER
ncbi:MAG: PspA/IM30 family protein, partial [Hyphomicrobiaceae bacterium]